MIGLCEFDQIADMASGYYRCRKCGYEPPARFRVQPEEVRRKCPADGDVPVKITAQSVSRYAVAVRKWIRAGSPTRDDAEVDRIAEVCAQCDKYSGGNCSMCGCAVRSTRDEHIGHMPLVSAALRNKIRMATEECPLRCKQCRRSTWACDCGRPPVRVPGREITRTNFIYHCCPLKSNDVWRDNLSRIVPVLSRFNGRRVVAVAIGEGLHGLVTVAKEFGRQASTITWVIVPNDRQLRETASLEKLLRQVESTEPHEATFYAHTKGNSTSDNVEGARLWRNAMYRELLGNFDECLMRLEKHDAVGTHKMRFNGRSPPYPTKLRLGTWMFAGTFFWFRHDAVFSQPHWSRIAQDRYGAEAWISTVVSADRAKSVYQPWPEFQYPAPNPYDPKLYQESE